jgi:hypothetical protein
MDWLYMGCGWVMGGFGLAVDGLWIDCIWAVDVLWVGCAFAVDGLCIGCRWAVDLLWMGYTSFEIIHSLNNTRFQLQGLNLTLNLGSRKPW